MRPAGGIVYNGIQYLLEYMFRKKEVTIGITINLENYENLRLEVAGDVENSEDVDDLVMFLDGMLARLGRGDPATAERVDAYRRRVLTMRPAETQSPETEAARVPAASRAPEPGTQEELSCPPADVVKRPTPVAQEHPAPPHARGSPAKPEVTIPKQPEPLPEQAPPQPEPAEPAEPDPSRSRAEDVCEVCGAEVTKSQAKLSMLFMSKILCKKCMERP